MPKLPAFHALSSDSAPFIPRSRSLLAAAEIVRLALLMAGSLQEFFHLLRERGYVFRIRGFSPTLLPLHGGRHIRLDKLGLRSAFWIRFYQWGEDLRSLGSVSQPLERFWQALTHVRLGDEERASVAHFRTALGEKMVAAAMCATVRDIGHGSPEEQFRYFGQVCWNRIRAMAGSSSVA